MQMNDIRQPKSRQEKKRVGRGGRRGKTSGHGHKGQKARAGNSMRPQLRDTIKKIPKLRGFQFSHRKDKDVTTVNVDTLAQAFASGETVSPETLVAKGIVIQQGGKRPSVKILGDGQLSVKLTVSGCAVSEQARQKIEAAGGSIA